MRRWTQAGLLLLLAQAAAGAPLLARSLKHPAALADAAFMGADNTVQALLAAGADPNEKVLEWTPLVAAAQGRNLEVARRLVAAGADVNLSDPVCAAARRGADDIVALLRAAGARASCEEDTLIGVAEHGDVARLRKLLPTTSKALRNRALFSAVQRGRLDMVEALLGAGADVRAAEVPNEVPLVVTAMEAKNRALVARLVTAGVRLDVTNHYDVTPLGFAAEEGWTEIIPLLAARGVSIDARSNSMTALEHAISGDRVDAARALIAAGADVNLGNGGGYTPLMFAAGDGKIALVKLLLAAHAAVDARNDVGATALWLAAMRGRVDVVKLLVAAGADTHATNKYGRSVRDMADPRNVELERALDGQP
jgi:ankyrin repeat protein